MLYGEIKNEIKAAMKNKDITKRDALKMVIDKARAISKEKNPNVVSEDIADDIIIQAIQKEIKQLNQTKDALKGKEDSKLYAETTHKIAISSVYLPTMMNREEVEARVKTILSNGDYLNFGMKMKAVMAELKGKADNKLIKEVVETYK